MSIQHFSDVLALLSGAVAESADIAALCRSVWDEPVTVHEDVDPTAPPVCGPGPVVLLASTDRHRTPEQDALQHTVAVCVGVPGGGEQIETISGRGTVVRQLGRASVEPLARLVERTMVRALQNAAVAVQHVPLDSDRQILTPDGAAFDVYYGLLVTIHDPL